MTQRPLLAAATAALGLALLASCTPRIVPEPRASQPAPTPEPPPPAPLAADWQDWPLTPGTWVYRQRTADPSALYGPPAAEPVLTIACDRTARQIRLSVAGAAGASGSQMLTIRTSFGVLQWPAESTVDSAAGATSQLVAIRAAGDQGLDSIVFSRGRFTVEVPGRAPLVLPTWAEPARVVEDCRG